jgi:outer membrane protein assembly factor BamA
MLPLLRFLAVVGLLACALPLLAQEYQPKAIRFEGAPAEDQARLLAITGLAPGAKMTKEQIEGGLGKLADTGSFTDLSYTVNSQSLVIKLGSSDNAGLLPVRFANFLWWTPEELEHLLEAEVPIYHGQLSLTGSLTTEVEAALVKLAKQKGLDIKVSAMRGGNDVVLSIDQPRILVGEVTLPEAKPAFGPTSADLASGLRGQDVDLVSTAETVVHDTGEVFRNTGYLDATVEAPVFSTPRAVPGGYAVDIKAEVHPGERYRVVQLTIVPDAPLQEADLRPASELKKGDPASPMGLLISGQKMQRLYAAKGYLDADAAQSTSLDNVAHTASYTLTLTARALYHLAGIVAGSLPVEAQAELAKDKRLAPGVVADSSIFAAIEEDLAKLYPHQRPRMELRANRLEHTVTIVVQIPTAKPRG